MGGGADHADVSQCSVVLRCIVVCCMTMYCDVLYYNIM